MFNIDLFKVINDSHGHHVGDMVMVELVKTVQDNIRASDILVRWGGDEFLILSPGIDIEQASTLANKILTIVSEHEFASIGHLTISLGLTNVNLDDTLDSLYSRVDDAMYWAKHHGRNQVKITAV